MHKHWIKATPAFDIHKNFFIIISLGNTIAFERYTCNLIDAYTIDILCYYSSNNA